MPREDGEGQRLDGLGEGLLRVTTGGKELRFQVAGGFLQVAENEVTVLSERAEAAA